MDPITRRLRIFGRVQGVFFRDSLRQQALALGVTGWVRNCLDGSVEAMLHGPPGAVEALIAWARQGPPQARVKRLEVEPATGEFPDFQRLPTAECGEASHRLSGGRQ